MANEAYQYQWYSVEKTLVDEDRKTRYFPDSLAAAKVTQALELKYSQVKPSGKYLGQWYVDYVGEAFYAQGILNQFIYVDPAKELVIVRQGKKWDEGYLDLFAALTAKK